MTETLDFSSFGNQDFEDFARLYKQIDQRFKRNPFFLNRNYGSNTKRGHSLNRDERRERKGNNSNGSSSSHKRVRNSSNGCKGHENGDKNCNSHSNSNSNSINLEESSISIYHYVHLEKSTGKYMVEKQFRTDLKCPWCSFNPESYDHPGLGKYREALLEHLKSYHFHYIYYAMYDQNGNFLIFMMRDREHSQDFISLKKEIDKPFEMNMSNKRRMLQLIPIIPNNEIPIEEQVCDAEVQQECRQYYNPRTCIPFVPEENIDRSDEADTEAVLKEANDSLDEHSDTPHEDRLFMKLWNEHVSVLIPYADSYLPMVLEEFVAKYSSQIIRLHLRYQFLIHLLSLMDFGILRRDEMEKYIKVIDDETAEQKKMIKINN